MNCDYNVVKTLGYSIVVNELKIFAENLADYLTIKDPHHSEFTEKRYKELQNKWLAKNWKSMQKRSEEERVMSAEIALKNLSVDCYERAKDAGGWLLYKDNIQVYCMCGDDELDGETLIRNMWKRVHRFLDYGEPLFPTRTYSHRR